MKSQVLVFQGQSPLLKKKQQQQQQIDGRVSFSRRDLDLKEEEEEGGGGVRDVN